jgi:hypothetical protein
VVAVVALANSACFGGHRIEQALEPAFPNLALADTIEVKDMKGLVMVSGRFATSSEAGDRIERAAVLANPANKSWRGVAMIGVDRKDGQMTSDEIEIDIEGLPDDTHCTVFIDGLEVSKFMTDDDGEAEVHLRRSALAARY